ncbi:MAG: LOG family protein [Candidatus Melainabacteria bacterium]|nr:LOG family protein [Candidatus Melainabacteria bacterium]
MTRQLNSMRASLARLNPTRREDILKQAAEWIDAAAALEEVKQRGLIIVGFMGSAREHNHTKEACLLIEEIASRLGPRFAVLTGGGDAVMAANRGARTGGSFSIGLNLLAPRTPEQRPNEYLDLAMPHSGFGHRLDNFLTYADIIVMGIGGYGTDLEEVFYRQCIQVATHREIPLVYLKPSFWRGKLDLIRQQLESKLISPEDLRMLHMIAEDSDLSGNGALTGIDRQLFHVSEEGKTEADRATGLIMQLAAGAASPIVWTDPDGGQRNHGISI